jgi:Rod binding domain-containing protein
MADLSIKASSATQSVADAHSATAIRNLRSDILDNQKKEKIVKSARDFESILIGQWLEQAEKSFATVPGDDPDKDNQDPGQDQMRSIAFRALADGMAKAGGIGIASMIQKHLESAEAKAAQNEQGLTGLNLLNHK